MTRKQLLILTTLLTLAGVARAQNTAFTYQGRLQDSGAPATGPHDFEFRLFDDGVGGAQVGAVLTLDDLGVSNGLFTATLDFGANFPGAARFLEIAVRPGESTGDYTALSPRQPITATPYAIQAASSAYASTAVAAGSVLGLAIDPSLSSLAVGTNTASGDASTALGRSAATGDNSTAMGNSTAGGAYATAMGSSTVGAWYSTAMGRSLATNDFATAMGWSGAHGRASTAMGSSRARGEYSTAMGESDASGAYSTALGDSTASGDNSTALGRFSLASGRFSTAMGNLTTASGGNSTAMGLFTTASGETSTAMGYRANALHTGSLVWADRQEADFDSTAQNQFSIRAEGGVRLNNDTSLSFGNQTRQMINLWNTEYAIGVQADAAYFRTGNEFLWYRGGSHSDTYGDPGAGGSQLMRLGNNGNLVIAGTLSQGSDRNVKQDFARVDAEDVLAKVVALPLQTWSYTNQPGVKHIGPMAQDFRAAFGTGEDNQHIATVDADGVALAAIQGLNQKLEEQLRQKDAELKSQQRQIAELLTRLTALEGKLRTPTTK